MLLLNGIDIFSCGRIGGGKGEGEIILEYLRSVIKTRESKIDILIFHMGMVHKFHFINFISFRFESIDVSCVTCTTKYTDLTWVHQQSHNESFVRLGWGFSQMIKKVNILFVRTLFETKLDKNTRLAPCTNIVEVVNPTWRWGGGKHYGPPC